MGGIAEHDAEFAYQVAEGVVDLPGLQHACTAVARSLGFDFVELTQRLASSARDTPPILSVSTFPQVWRDRYSNGQWALQDPILRLAHTIQRPIIWGPSVNRGLPELLAAEEQFLEQSAVDGVAIVASHAMCGRHGEITLVMFGRRCESAIRRISEEQDSEAKLVFRMRAFLSVLHEAANSVRNQTMPQVRLSNREKDVLALIRAGGSTASIARALNIAGRTVYEHLTTAGHKLKTTGRHRIAQKAVDLGLIDTVTHAIHRGLERHFATGAPGGPLPAAATEAGIAETRFVAQTETVPAEIAAANRVETFEWRDLQHRMDEFALAYQPIVDIRSDRLVECESLLRWSHPRFRPYFSPSTFIPRLERTRAIYPIGIWVIRRALEQLRYWSISGGSPNMAVAVNVSPLQVNQAGFAEDVIRHCETFQIPTSRLVLEITESRPIAWDETAASENVELLHAAGVKIYLDDFGCGHASLTNLQRTKHIHGVKIDCSLVAEITREPRVATLVRSMVRMAQDLGLEIIGEGVETKGQLETLANMGVERMQGFLFSHAVAPERVIEWDRERRRGAPATPQGPMQATPSGKVILTPADVETATAASSPTSDKDDERRPRRTPSRVSAASRSFPTTKVAAPLPAR